MNDTISRIWLLNRLKHHRDVFCKNRIEFLGLSRNDKARVDEIDNCIAEVINAPTIELERETGTWIIDSGYPQHCWCSECNHLFSLFDPKSIHFCPNCGREMKTRIWKSLDEKEKE